MISLETKIMEVEQYVINTEEKLSQMKVRIDRATLVINELRGRDLSDEHLSKVNTLIDQFNVEIERYNQTANELNEYKALLVLYNSFM